MSQDPLRRAPRRTSSKPDASDRPRIWAEGGQRPPFDLRALARASLWLARTGVAPLLGWSARRLRQGAERVRDGAGRISAERLGRAAPFVPSHLRVAGWIKTGAAIFAHASANADPDVSRGNALVAEIEPHLWEEGAPPPAPTPAPSPTVAPPKPETATDAQPERVDPVVLPEPMQPPTDPLAAIRNEMATDATAGQALAGRKALRAPGQGPGNLPPGPPGPLAVTAIQVAGYLLGWGTTLLALPYGLARALWSYASGTDLRGIGRED